MRSSDGCVPSEISNQPTFWFLPLHVIGCSTLHCAEMFTECLQWWQNLFLHLDHFLGPSSLKASEKHLCELGWPLAGLTGWAEVEDVFTSEGIFRINVLFLSHQTNHCVFVTASLCKETNTTWCSWLLWNTEAFLSVPGKNPWHFSLSSLHLSWCETKLVWWNQQNGC